MTQLVLKSPIPKDSFFVRVGKRVSRKGSMGCLFVSPIYFSKAVAMCSKALATCMLMVFTEMSSIVAISL